MPKLIPVPAIVVLLAFSGSAFAADGADLYHHNCQPCHGLDGRGLDPSSSRYKSFDAPPADFTDPMFNSREPTSDWTLVVKYGGERMGLSSQMPTYEGALTDEEISAVVAHLGTLAYTENFPSGDLNFTRPVSTIKAFPENEALLITRYDARDGAENAARITAYYAQRFGARHQGEVKVTHLDDGVRSEIADVELGWKWAFHDNLERSRLMATGLEVEIPVDSGDEGSVFVPYLSTAHGLSDSFTVQTTFRSHLPTDGIGEGDVKASAVLHWIPVPWRQGVFPGIEGTVTAPFDGDRGLEGSLIPQAFFGLNRRGHVALTVGVEVPVGDLPYEYRIHAFLLWDIADGAFWKGW